MDIFKTFKAAANPDKAASMCAYMRNQFPYLGIQAPERKKLSRDFFKTLGRAAVDWQFIYKCWQQPEREFQYLAIDYLTRLKTALNAGDIPNLRKIAIQKPWWDTIDGLSTIVGNIALRYPEVDDILLGWSKDENLWLRRIAIIHQLTRKGKTNPGLLELIIINNLGQTEFFINKAIGWSLRAYSKTNPDWVRSFMARHENKMARLSIREASKYLHLPGDEGSD
jgi:3-methyladenine DNA glycosylase AlkD